ncbi:MAG TPA: BamA/TamA family outer membrane protein [Gemmatimonadaceae bacterium]|nr:BamA/TamA family outer membrane protein [Gemmatimonadaceae bacterium]
MRSQPVPGWLRLAIVGCLAVGALPVIAGAQARNKNPIEAPEVRSLDLRGVESVDPLDLERSIASQATTCKNVLLTLFCRMSRSGNITRKAYLDRDEIARDMLRIRVYYWKRGFRSTQVDTAITRTSDGDDVEVVFNITEGPPTIVRRIQISYDSLLLREKRVRKMTLLKAGQPLDLIKIDSMRISFANEMWSEGHSDATVDTVITVDEERRLADVRLTLIPNHTTFVGDIVITGLDKVDRQTVLNSITLRPGELFRASDVLESQRNLFESNLFRLAAVEVPPQFDSVKRVTITVAESPLHEVQTGVGLTNIEFLQTDAQYTAYNLLGGARRLDVTATVGNILGQQLAGKGFFYNPEEVIPGASAGKYLQPTWAASIDFRQPAFLHRPKNQAGVSAFAHRRSTPGIFIDRGYGGAVTLTNQVRVRAPVSLTYRFEVNRVDAGDVYFCVNFGVCDDSTIHSLRAHQRLSPVNLGGFIDRSDNPLDPTRGYQARADLEHASALTLSDYGYSRAFFDIAAYNHHGFTSTYGAHFRLGLLRASGGTGEIHPRKRFYAGGATSVRGYATNQLGPRVLTIASSKLDSIAGCSAATYETTCDPNGGYKASDFNPQPLGGKSVIEGSVEYRMPIGFQRKLTAAAFIDGAVVGSASVADFASLRRVVDGQWAITPGFGIRYKSPVGPIRIDLGFNPQGEEELAVVTDAFRDGERQIVTLRIPRRYAPNPRLLDRFTLHFSIGQAY